MLTIKIIEIIIAAICVYPEADDTVLRKPKFTETYCNRYKCYPDKFTNVSEKGSQSDISFEDWGKVI